MKIALVIEHFDAARGGAEHFAVWLAEQLVQHGHDVHVLCHDSARRSDRYRAAHHGASHDAIRSATAGGIKNASPPGAHIHQIRAAKLSTGMGFRQFGRGVERWCHANAPDVVHSITVAFPGDVYHPQPGVYARIQAQAISSRENPAAANFKRFTLGLSGKQRVLLEMEKKATAQFNSGGPAKIVCISASVDQDFKDIYGVAAAQRVRLENPMMYGPVSAQTLTTDRQWFRSAYHLADNARVAIFAGHDFRRKGLAWAIRALAQAQTDWTLVVVGLGKVRKYLRIAEDLKVSARVKFIGPTRQIHRVYAGGDALLFPTFYDSFGLVALEAMAHGLFIISTRFLGCASIVTELKMGSIVDSPRSVSDMAKALDGIEPSLPRQLARAADVSARLANLGPAAYMKSLEAIYHQVAVEKSKFSGRGSVN